jgi:hypothetical protein
MKFHIDDIDSYDGSDLILMVGAPGSRWSSVHRTLCDSSSINNSDWTEDKTWTILSKTVYGDVRGTGGHYGSYWGPGNLYGQNFGRLDSLSKKEILTEFMNGYETWDKIKIIKSHWFAYNISYISNMFPKAKILSVYANDTDCFFWWHKCGGWDMSYANYAWYENDNKMLEQIKQENSHILKFSVDRDLIFKMLSYKDLYEKLNLEYTEDISDRFIKTKVTVYDGSYVDNFEHILQKEQK